ncbi:MAG: murein peptide amidase [Paucimonas sp.]|nr:murein peptide amidase [Paucimonas sp.]
MPLAARGVLTAVAPRAAVVIAALLCSPGLPAAAAAPSPPPSSAPASQPPAAPSTAPIASQPAFPSASQPAEHSADLSRWCAQVVPRLPRIDLRHCLASGLAPTGAHSRKQVPIFSRRMAAQREAPKPLRILLIGGMHGDELTSSAVVFEWMKLQAAAPRQEYHWHFVPVLNPDGLLAASPSRVNGAGVDLNRNFPTPGWNKEAPAWWTQKTKRDPRRYPGKTPLSEPESRWLHQEIDRFTPDLVVSVHAPFGVLDFDGPAPAPERFGNLRMDRVGVYPGSLGNYGGYYKHIPVVTIELANARQMPSPRETRQIWDDMQRWVALNLVARPNGRGAAAGQASERSHSTPPSAPHRLPF